MFPELPILQGECAVCVLCNKPIVGDILHCAGSPACEGCAATFQSEYDELIDNVPLGDGQPFMPIGSDAYDQHYDYSHP